MITQNELWIIAQDNVASLTRYFIALRTGDKKQRIVYNDTLLPKFQTLLGLRKTIEGWCAKPRKGWCFFM